MTEFNKSDRLFLVGLMGAGKTTIGKLLSEALDYRFVDTDHEIEKRTGADIAWIFDVEGETGFRQREQAAIEELTLDAGIVLATGGGVVLREENRQCLLQRGFVVYLCCDINALLDRTRFSKKRPLLQVEDRGEVYERLFSERDKFYRDVADVVIVTTDCSPQEVVVKILDVFPR